MKKMKKFLTTSKVYTSFLVVIISFFTCLELFRFSQKELLLPRKNLLQHFNHTFSSRTPFPKSSTWITSIPTSSTLYSRSQFFLKQQRRPPPKRLNHDTDEKYLTFFTHSGFQNQLIQGTAFFFTVT